MMPLSVAVIPECPWPISRGAYWPPQLMYGGQMDGGWIRELVRDVLLVHGVIFKKIFLLVVGTNSKLDEQPRWCSERTFSKGFEESFQLLTRVVQHWDSLVVSSLSNQASLAWILPRDHVWWLCCGFWFWISTNESVHCLPTKNIGRSPWRFSSS